MIINRIFINKKTGNLIIIYCDWKNNFLEIYNQSKNKMQPLSLQFGYSVIPITQYITIQLDDNWIRANKLTTFIWMDIKDRYFCFKNKCYRQVIFLPTLKVSNFKEISKEYFKIGSADIKSANKERKNSILKNIKTSQYIRDFNLFSMLKDL